MRGAIDNDELFRLRSFLILLADPGKARSVAAGIIARHDFREGRARYETSPEAHHDHLINIRSGEVIEFQSEEIERLQAEIARKLGYRLVDHRLELYAVPLKDDKSKSGH